MINASELAQLGVCEQLIVFERTYGKKKNPEQRQAIARGNALHRAFYAQAIAAQLNVETSEAGRCVIATATLGAGNRETQLLRGFRDSVLAKNRVGQLIARGYHKIWPPVAGAIAESSLLRPIVVVLLNPIVWVAEMWSRGRSGSLDR